MQAPQVHSNFQGEKAIKGLGVKKCIYMQKYFVIFNVRMFFMR
jgi:hypothetical protein